MIRIQLSPDEVNRLERLFRTTEDRKLRDRLQIVLMAHRGRPRLQIAEDLGIHRIGVTRWLNAYREGGLDALRPKEAPGGTPGIPASAAEEIRRWVIEGPAAQGLDRANWTHEELADHLKKTRGIKTSRSAMHRFCSKIGVRPYRPTYRYLRGDKDKQAKAREDLAALEKKRPTADSSC
ncbi:MAG: helix-turn-helix domain-containing protein [Gemmataceae bacterium]